MIVADEPTGDLDRDSADEILDLLEKLSAEENKTIVMVTHDPKAAQRAKRCLELEKGKLVPNSEVLKWLLIFSQLLPNVVRNRTRSLLTIVGVATGMFLLQR